MALCLSGLQIHR